MATWKSLLTAVVFVAFAAVAPPTRGEDNAPDENRTLVANILETSLVKEAAKVKFEPPIVETRHKEEVKLNPQLPAIVTFWRSELAVKATFVDPETKLKVEVPKMVREKDIITVLVSASAPIKGDAVGRAMTDDRKELIKAASPFTATIKVTAECTLTRVREKDEVKVQIVIKEWKPCLNDLKFEKPFADKLRDPIQKAANAKLTEAADSLRKTANDALKKAYDDGKLKFNP